MKIKLIITLKDGSQRIGTYPWLVALARLDHASKQSQFADFALEGAR